MTHSALYYARRDLHAARAMLDRLAEALEHFADLYADLYDYASRGENEDDDPDMQVANTALAAYDDLCERLRIMWPTRSERQDERERVLLTADAFEQRVTEETTP